MATCTVGFRRVSEATVWAVFRSVVSYAASAASVPLPVRTYSATNRRCFTASAWLAIASTIVARGGPRSLAGALPTVHRGPWQRSTFYGSGRRILCSSRSISEDYRRRADRRFQEECPRAVAGDCRQMGPLTRPPGG